jgi:glucosylceramidase
MTPNLVQVVRTSRGSQDRLAELPALTFGAMPGFTVASITVDSRKRFQTFEGFGGAFTEAAALTFAKLSPELRAEILKAYFDPREGHGYRFCRTHINSCDFSTGNYAYAEVPDDLDLAQFSIDRDRQALIPFIKAATSIAGQPLQLLASPWSPPAWMKTNGQMNGGGKLKPEHRDVWARYYCRYIHEYQQEGIPIWGVSVQNEPEATQTWDSCIYTGAEERDFVRDFLGPALAREGLADIRVVIWDHNRDRMYERAKVVYDDPHAAKYVWGTGFHWYAGDNFDNVQLVHDAYPDKQLLFTEGCQEEGTHHNSWNLGERYARSIINDLNRWTVGWIDWNLILDESGGPNHVGNLCSAPIIAHLGAGQLFYESSFYYIGHFARYIRPGAERILCATTGDDLEATAFRNLDGRIAVVVLNRSVLNLPFALKYAEGAAMTEIPARSIMTFCFASE